MQPEKKCAARVASADGTVVLSPTQGDEMTLGRAIAPHNNLSTERNGDPAPDQDLACKTGANGHFSHQWLADEKQNCGPLANVQLHALLHGDARHHGRRWYVEFGGELIVVARIELLPVLIAALQEAEAEARRRGLLPAAA